MGPKKHQVSAAVPTRRPRHLDYYAVEPSHRFQCQCSWVGPFSDLGTEHFKELFEASCPSCGTTLAIVSFPTEADVRHAARQGNKRAQEELESVGRREAFVKRYAARELVRPDQLPDVEGAELNFEWDSVTTGTNNEVVIRLLPDGPEIWREVEAYENWPHFIEVKSILLARYASRFKTLTPTSGAMFYLYGDDVFACMRDAHEDAPPEWVATGHSSATPPQTRKPRAARKRRGVGSNKK